MCIFIEGLCSPCISFVYACIPCVFPGEKFMSVGLCTEAVTAFEKANDPKAAIDACVVLNQVTFSLLFKTP